MSKCTDCGINEACEGEETCQECFDGYTVEIIDSIPISEIERVITKLEKERVKNKIESYKDVSTATSAFYEGIVLGIETSIKALKELLPK